MTKSQRVNDQFQAVPYVLVRRHTYNDILVGKAQTDTRQTVKRKGTDLLFLIRTHSCSTKSKSPRSNRDLKMGGSVSDFGFVVLKYI